MGHYGFHRQAGRWVDGQMAGWLRGQMVCSQLSDQHFSLGALHGYWGSEVLLKLHTAHTEGEREPQLIKQ